MIRKHSNYYYFLLGIVLGLLFLLFPPQQIVAFSFFKPPKIIKPSIPAIPTIKPLPTKYFKLRKPTSTMTPTLTPTNTPTPTITNTPTPTATPSITSTPTPTPIGAKHVNRGDVIGIMGNTGFSTGAHLHFSVYNLCESERDKFNFDSGHENPFNYLQNREVIFEPMSCDDISSRTLKSIGNGSWDWPLSNPTISQCYGHTPWSWRYQNDIHNGIDMYDDNNPLVKAVESGNAYIYRGGQVAGNGVFIFHDNCKMSLYWQLQ